MSSTIGGTKMYGSNGISGLVSGMDTESMVESLLSGTQSKIDSQYAKRQQLEWKQEIYRDIISDVRSFQTKFFSYSNPTSNILSSSFFNSLNSNTGSSSAINVTASSSAVSGKTSIDYIKTLATATKKTSGSEVSGKIEGKLNTSKLTSTANVTIKIGSTEHNITLDASSQDNLIKSLNNELGTDVATINKDGKLVIDGHGEEITVSGFSDGLAILGLSETKTATGTLETMHDLSKGVPYLTINMDGVEKNIFIDFDYKDNQEFIKKLNSKIKSTIGSGLTVEQNVPAGDEVVFKADGGRQVTLVGGSALDAFGIEDGASNKINLNISLKDVNFGQELIGNTFVFKLNGVTFAASGEESIKHIMERVNNSDAGVTMSYSSSQDKFVVESKTTGEGVDIEMSQSSGNLLSVMFGSKPSGGVASGTLEKDSIIATNSTTDSNFTGVTSGEFKLILNGTEVTFDLPKKDDDYDVDSVLAEINKQLKSRVSEGSITLERNTNDKIVIKASSEWNVSLPSTVEADTIAEKLGFTKGQSTKADKTTTLSELGLSGKIEIGGKEIILGNLVPPTIGNLASEINGALGGNGSCSFDEAAGALMITGATSSVEIKGADTAGNTSLEKLFASSSFTLGGISETVLSNSNFKNGTDIIGVSGTIKVNDKSISLTSTMTVDAVAKEIQDAVGEGTCKYKQDKGGFVICGVTIPITFQGAHDADKAVMDKLFGSQSINIANDGTTLANKGSNAVFSVNGKEVEKNTNSFTMDGLDMELKETTDEAVTIDTTRNTEQISKGIEDFVEEYNTLIDKLNGLVHEDSDYKEYAPLTDDQRKEMTDDQIKLWEEKAKTGLVRNDSVVRGFLQEMRNILYQKPEGCKLALYDLGIETSKEYKDYGKLVIKDPAKLKNTIETQASEIQKLFTSEKDGLSVKFNDALDAVAKASTASPGSLVQLAGIKGGTLDKGNSITKSVNDVKDTITSLKNKYEMEKNRYWKQFNSMEKMIQQMNQQSSWLMQQFA